MSVRFAPLALPGMLCLMLSACGGILAKPVEVTPTEPKPVLTDEAKTTLAQVEAEAQVAKTNITLWVPAEKALKNAQEAARNGDSATVLKEARKASELIKLGAAQAAYPSTEQTGQRSGQLGDQLSGQPRSDRK